MVQTKFAHRPRRRSSASGILSLLVLLAGAAPALGQGSDKLPELSSLRPSAAPAFILLGVSPEAIQRPSTPSDLALQALNRTTGLQTVPEDLAVEAAPLWLFGHPDLSWRGDTTRNVWQSIQRTATVSIGSAQLGTEEAPVTGLALGLSFDVLSGRISRAMQDTLAQIESSLTRQGTIYLQFAKPHLQALEDWFQQEIARRPEEIQAIRQVYQRRKQEIETTVREDPEYQQRLEAERERFQDFALVRQGWFLNVATGGAWNFPGQVWENGEFRRFGVWTTLSYEGTDLGREVRITPLAVARFLTQAEDTLPHVFDAGGRLVLSGATYAASAEWVVRTALGEEEHDPEHRLVGIFEYRLGPDTWLQGSFGRDHESPSGSNVVARLGISFSLSRDRFQTPQ